MKILKIIVFASALLIWPVCHADVSVSWITIDDGSGGTVRALKAVNGPFPQKAVIFHHGTEVRYKGAYSPPIVKCDPSDPDSDYGEGAWGLQVREYLEAFADAGYLAIAPIRKKWRCAAYKDSTGMIGDGSLWDEVVLDGITVTDSLMLYIDTEYNNIGLGDISIVGFSEGGAVSLWHAIQGDYSASKYVFISPASLIKDSDDTLTDCDLKDATWHINWSATESCGSASGDADTSIGTPTHLLYGVAEYVISGASTGGLVDLYNGQLIPALNRSASLDNETTLIRAYTGIISNPADHDWFYIRRNKVSDQILEFLDTEFVY